MKIKIEDHDTTVSTRRDKYRWNVVFTVGIEGEHGFSRNLCADFTDWLAFLQAGGVIDSFEGEEDNGAVWVDDLPYTFDAYIRECMLQKQTDTMLAEYIIVRLSEVKAAAV